METGRYKLQRALHNASLSYGWDYVGWVALITGAFAAVGFVCSLFTTAGWTFFYAAEAAFVPWFSLNYWLGARRAKRREKEREETRLFAEMCEEAGVPYKHLL